MLFLARTAASRSETLHLLKVCADESPRWACLRRLGLHLPAKLGPGLVRWGGLKLGQLLGVCTLCRVISISLLSFPSAVMVEIGRSLNDMVQSWRLVHTSRGISHG